VAQTNYRDDDFKILCSTPTVLYLVKPDVNNELKRLHEKYVLNLAHKVCNNFVFVCKTHYFNYILIKLGMNSTFL
jgi:hypothetical protein